MTNPADIKEAILNETTSLESLEAFYPNFMRQLSVPNTCSKKYFMDLFGAMSDVITSKTAPPVQKFHVIYLLLKATELSNQEPLMALLAQEDELLTDVFRIGQYDTERNIPVNERGKHYFKKSGSKAEHECGINFVRICYEAIIYWGTKYGSSNAKDSSHIYYFLAENLKKKGKSPFRYYFIEKQFDLSSNIAVWNFRDRDPPLYEEALTNIPEIPEKLARNFSFNPVEAAKQENEARSIPRGESEKRSPASQLHIPLTHHCENGIESPEKFPIIKAQVLREQQGNFHSSLLTVPESIMNPANSSPCFKTEIESVKQATNENISPFQIEEHLKNMTFEKKIMEVAAARTSETSHNDTPTGGAVSSRKTEYRLNIVPIRGVELENESIDEETKMKSKKFEKELLEIEISVKRSFERKSITCSPVSFAKSSAESLEEPQIQRSITEKIVTGRKGYGKEENESSGKGINKDNRSTLRTLYENYQSEQKPEMMKMLGVYEPVPTGRLSRGSSEKGLNNISKVKLALKIGEAHDAYSLGNLDHELNKISPISRDKQWNSVTFPEDMPKKKYDPFSRSPLAKDDGNQRISAEKKEQRLRGGGYLTPKDVEANEENMKDYENRLKRLENELQKLKKENSELRGKGSSETMQSLTGLDEKLRNNTGGSYRHGAIIFEI